MKPRRLPNGPRVIPSAFLSQVPDVIGARIETQLQTVSAHQNQMVADAKERDLRDRLQVLHIPTREGFEGLALKGRVQTPEVKIDEETSRVYLVGAGSPGRQERHVDTIPVEDEAGVIAEQLYTDIVEKGDIVVAYTEVGLGEFRQAADTVNELGPATRKGLSYFFKLPASHLTGLVLALASHTTSDLRNIAKYALRQKGYA